MLPQVEMPPSLLLLINSEYIMVHTSTIHQGTTSITYDTVSLAQDITTEWTLTTLTIPLTTPTTTWTSCQKQLFKCRTQRRMCMVPVLEDLPPLPLLPLEVLITSLGLVYLDMESIMVWLLVLGGSWTYTPRRGREVQLLFCLFIY